MAFRAFEVPPNELGPDYVDSCQFFVYQQAPRGELYFFGHSVLHCLGEPRPHVALPRVVPPDERHTVPLATGLFLKEDTVKRLAQGKPSFLSWLHRYLANCHGAAPGPNCPSP